MLLMRAFLENSLVGLMVASSGGDFFEVFLMVDGLFLTVLLGLGQFRSEEEVFIFYGSFFSQRGP